MDIEQLRQTITNAQTLLARDIHNATAEIKRLQRQRAEHLRELDRQQGALAALDMLDDSDNTEEGGG